MWTASDSVINILNAINCYITRRKLHLFWKLDQFTSCTFTSYIQLYIHSIHDTIYVPDELKDFKLNELNSFINSSKSISIFSPS